MKGGDAVVRVRAIALVAFTLIALAAFSSPLHHADFSAPTGGSPTTQSATEAPPEASASHSSMSASDGLSEVVGACGLLLLCAGLMFSLFRRPRPTGRGVTQRRSCPEPLLRNGAVLLAFKPLHRLVVRRC